MTWNNLLNLLPISILALLTALVAVEMDRSSSSVPLAQASDFFSDAEAALGDGNMPPGSSGAYVPERLPDSYFAPQTASDAKTSPEAAAVAANHRSGGWDATWLLGVLAGTFAVGLLLIAAGMGALRLPRHESPVPGMRLH